MILVQLKPYSKPNRSRYIVTKKRDINRYIFRDIFRHIAISTHENYLSYVYRMPKAITYRMLRCIDVAMYRKPCIDVAQFCNDLCIGQNVAMIRDTFVAFCFSSIHAEPTGFSVLN